MLRSTRGVLVTAAVGIAVMFILIRGHIDAAARRIFGGLFGVSLLLFPVVTQYRVMLRFGLGTTGVVLFREALVRATREASLSDVLLSGLASVLSRFIGADSILYLTRPETHIGLDGLIMLRSAQSSVTDYFTHRVVGIPLGMVHAEAPSLLGWFLIAGGWVGLTVGFALYLLGAWWVWVQVWHSRLLIKPLVQAQLLVLWLSLSSEGTIELLTSQVFPLVASFALLEMLLRRSVGNPAAERSSTRFARSPFPVEKLQAD
jgi:hypothetical protein